MSRGKGISVLVGLVVAAGVGSPALASPRAAARVTATAAIVVDGRTGQVLWQRNPDLPLPPASTTKIVTALLALQSGRLDDSFPVSPEAAQEPASKVNLRTGWRMRLSDLVYALLLNSANDASVVIAQGLAGSVPAFAERMNAEARMLGARNTHFVNPNGLPAADHYSSARDLATIFSHAMQNPLFAEIVGTKADVISPTTGSTRRIALHNHNRLLGGYPVNVVGKTGWTIAAKKCFVGEARAGERELFVAVLGSRDLWGDLRRLINFGFRGTNPPLPQSAVIEAAATAPPGAGHTALGVSRARRAHSYAVRLATFRRLRAAQRLKGAVARTGYPAWIERLRRGRHRLYRVSIGTYASRRVAQRVATRLKQAHEHLSPIVVARN